MANPDAAFGFREYNPLGHASTGAIRRYYHGTAAPAIFIGDAVTTTGTAHTDEFSTPIVEQADADNPLLGVCVGIDVRSPDALASVFSETGTADYVFINVDPNQLYTIQEDSDGGALAIEDTGQNIDLIPGTGSTVTGISAMEIDSDASKGTATAQLRLINILEKPGNALGTNAIWVVKLNEHELGGTGGL